MEEEKVLWKARKRNCFGLPWTFTVYSLTEDMLYIEIGFFNQRFEQIELYKIKDFTVKRTLFQRIFGLGTLHICSADTSTPELDLINIRDCMKVKRFIFNQVKVAKKAAGIKPSEFISDRPEGRK